MTDTLPSLQGTNTQGKYRNVAPRIPAAGKVQSDPLATAGSCVRHDFERPDTPDQVAPFRKSKQEVGRPVAHPGKSRDGQPPDIRFGKKNTYNDNALSLIQPDTRSLFLQKQEQLKEAVYRSVKTEPLGTRKQPVNGIEADPNTRFGIGTKASESSKSVMYPYQEAGEEELAASHAQYCKTHNSYDPGEQKKRAYDWEKHGIDPKDHRFGLTGKRGENGVHQAMSYDKEPATTIVKKAVEDFKDVAKDHLGKSKNQGFGNARNLPENFAFGYKNKPDEWGVKQCMMANLPAEEMEDKTLGKATRPGYRNDTSTSRTFGVPSVRHDVQRPAFKKVTNNNNYGDDANAYSLICPSKYVANDIREEDFLQPISKQDMYDLAFKSNFQLEDDEFEEAWQHATTYTDDGIVSIETFRNAVHELGL